MPRVLLVDDDIAEISSVKRVLLRAGHQPALATNASDAVAAIAQERPDLLIVSATCENGEALALARTLPDDAATAGIPLLLLGDADPLPQGARRLGRPLDPELLIAELNGALGTSSAIALEPPAKPPAPAPPPRTAIGKVQPARSVAPLILAAEAAAAGHPTRARPPQPGASPAPAREPPSGATALGSPLPGPPTQASPGLRDAAASRRAAAEALRARAEELRKAPRPAAPAAAPAAPAPRPAPATAPKPAPRAAQPGPAAPAPRPSPAAPVLLDPPFRPTRPSLAESLDLDEGEMEAALRLADAATLRDDAQRPEDPDVARRHAADEALRALEEEASSHAAEVARARRAGRATTEAAPPAGGEHGLQDAIATARREAFEAARRELQEQARQEAAEAARLVQAEARARQEAVTSAQRESQELGRQRTEAELRARAAEEQLRAMREQLEEERRKAEERVATVMQRAAQEGEAADELRRLAEDEIRRRDEESARSRAAGDEKLREAITSARAEMEALRRRTEEETRLRAEAESALQRLERARRQEAAQALEREVEAMAWKPVAPEPEPEAFTPDFFAPFDGAEAADAPPPDPAEDAARRRVAALRAPPSDAGGEDGLPSFDLGAPEPGRGEQGAPAELDEGDAKLARPPALLRAGELTELPVPRLLAMAAKAKLLGRLDFQGEVARSIWFEDGRVVGASSADPGDRVEEIALRLGLITRDQHRQVAQAIATLPVRRAALLLLERGFLKATELTGLVRRRTEEVVFGVFGEEAGRFRWTGVEVPPEERTALERSTLALAVEGVRRRWRGARVDALLGGPATLLSPVPGAPGPAELGLSPEERRLVALADGLRALDEIVQASPLDALSTRQVLAALVVTGSLAVRVLHAGRPRGQASASIDLARVKDKLEQVRRADYFTVLGVGRLCTPHEVREAADRLAAEFEPRRFAGVPDEGLPGRLAEIVQVIQDAREVLADDRLREEYLRGLGDAG